MTERKIKVYVAGPLTQGSQEENLLRALAAADQLLEAGAAPFVPHLFYYWDKVHPHSYEEWMALDSTWLDSCDCVLRLPGVSPGSDRETAQAEAMGIPVFHSVEQLLENCPLPR